MLIRLLRTLVLSHFIPHPPAQLASQTESGSSLPHIQRRSKESSASSFEMAFGKVKEAAVSQSVVGRNNAEKKHGIIGMLQNPYVFMTCLFASLGCMMVGLFPYPFAVLSMGVRVGRCLEREAKHTLCVLAFGTALSFGTSFQEMTFHDANSVYSTATTKESWAPSS
jgi:hypothetical protein